MNLKNIISFGIIGAIITTSAIAWADVKSSDYFAIRSKLDHDDVNDFQAKKFCKSLEGKEVLFESRVVSINSEGTILADMDIDKILSVPEIFLNLSDDDETLSIKEGQTIKYDGTISDCSYGTTSGILSLTITDGSLKLHY